MESVKNLIKSVWGGSDKQRQIVGLYFGSRCHSRWLTPFLFAIPSHQVLGSFTPSLLLPHCRGLEHRWGKCARFEVRISFLLVVTLTVVVLTARILYGFIFILRDWWEWWRGRGIRCVFV